MGCYRVLCDLHHYLITTVHDLPTALGVAHRVLMSCINVSVDTKAKQSPKVHIHTW